jgi:hypothetical protein
MAFPNSKRVQFNVEVDWKALPVHTNTLEGVSTDVEILRFRRERNSHRGIVNLIHHPALQISNSQGSSGKPLLQWIYLSWIMLSSDDEVLIL